MPRSIRWVMAWLAGVLLVGPGVALAQVNGVAGVEHYFQVQWEQTTGRCGPAVSGYVHNSYGYAAADVQIEVTGLDAAGAVVSRIYTLVLGTVAPFGDAYFRVRVAPGAASYRVTVVSFQSIGRGASS